MQKERVTSRLKLLYRELPEIINYLNPTLKPLAVRPNIKRKRVFHYALYSEDILPLRVTERHSLRIRAFLKPRINYQIHGAILAEILLAILLQPQG